MSVLELVQAALAVGQLCLGQFAPLILRRRAILPAPPTPSPDLSRVASPEATQLDPLPSLARSHRTRCQSPMRCPHEARTLATRASEVGPVSILSCPSVRLVDPPSSAAARASRGTSLSGASPRLPGTGPTLTELPEAASYRMVRSSGSSLAVSELRHLDQQIKQEACSSSGPPLTPMPALQ